MSRSEKDKESREAVASNAPWARLTWDDLSAWTNSRSLERGRRYHRSGRVSQLARTPSGGVLAWVQGTQRYATAVEPSAEDESGVGLRSRCSCPVGYKCKHAVAVVLASLDAVRGKETLPLAAENDRRWKLIAEMEEDFGDEDEEGWDEEEDAEAADEEEPDEEEVAPPARRRKKRDSLREYLAGKPTDELVEIILSVAERHPEVGEDLRRQQVLRSGSASKLVERARREIDNLTAEPAWRNSWTGGGEMPDYSGLKQLFEKLLERGEADALLDLGWRLLRQGEEQIGGSDDEGETAGEIIDCLNVVFRAVLRSSLTGPEKLMYAIDASLDDDYDLAQGSDVVFDHPWTAADWSAVADELTRRLHKAPKTTGDDFTSRYRRDRLCNLLIDALDAAGRREEALAVCEAEAPVTGSYERLVDRLLEEGRVDDARRWAIEGIEKIDPKWAGITHKLRQHLRDIAEKKKDWPLVAAYRAEEFFGQPSVEELKTLLKAAARAGCEEAVRTAALRFLETGIRPTGSPAEQAAAPPVARGRARAAPRKATSKAAAPATPRAAPVPWPLPALPLSPPESGRAARESQPRFDVLLDLAIAEKRPADVLAWYDRLREKRPAQAWGWYHDDGYASRVADAVADAYPDEALALYRELADRHIAVTNPAAYEAAAVPLRKMRALLLRLKRGGEWAKTLAELRETHHRKRRLLEVLDRLEGRPIIEG